MHGVGYDHHENWSSSTCHMVPRSSAGDNLDMPACPEAPPPQNRPLAMISGACHPTGLSPAVLVGPFQASTPSQKAWYPRARDATVPVKGASLTIHAAIVLLLSES